MNPLFLLLALFLQAQASAPGSQPAVQRSWQQGPLKNLPDGVSLRWSGFSTPTVLLQRGELTLDGHPILHTQITRIQRRDSAKTMLTAADLPASFSRLPSRGPVLDSAKLRHHPALPTLQGFQPEPLNPASTAWWPTAEGLLAVSVQDWQLAPCSAFRLVFDYRLLESMPLQAGKAGSVPTGSVPTGSVLTGSVPTAAVPSGRVFTPNPVIAGKSHALRDQNDAREAVPEGFYALVGMPSLNQAAPFLLEGPYAANGEISSPLNELAYSGRDFLFFRDESGFEEVNVYHHITRAQNYLQDLGVVGLQDRPLPYDAHALSGADSSQFAVWHDPKGSLEFGDGGVDDAEDADLIYHEYAHALHFAAAGPRLFSYSENQALPAHLRCNEALAIAEAVADWWTQLLTRDWALAAGMDPHLLMEWDSAGLRPEPTANQFYLRSTHAELHYPDQLSGDGFRDSQVLSQALVELTALLPDHWLERNIWLALALLPDQPLMADLREVLARLDLFLENGSHAAAFAQAFQPRGIAALHRLDLPRPGLAGSWQVGLLNPHLSECQVYLYAGEDSGSSPFSQQLALPARGSALLKVDLLFSQPERIAHIALLSPQPLIAWQEFRSADGLEWSAAPAMPPLASLDLPHVALDTSAWKTYLRLAQLAPLADELIFSRLGQTQARILDLPAQGSLLLQLPQDLSPPLDWAEIATPSSTPQLSAVEWFGRADGARMSAALALSRTRGTALLFPHIAADRSTFWTGLALVNPQEQPANASLTLSAADGSTLAQTNHSFAPGEKWVGLLEELFPQAPLQTAMFWLEADQPLFGYELFGTTNGAALAGLAATTSGSRTLVFPHIAVDDFTFTGLVLANLGQAPAHITITAFDGAGRSLLELNLEIAPRGRHAVLADALLGASTARSTRWVYALADQALAGFALLGDLPQRATLAALEALPLPTQTKEQPAPPPTLPRNP
jgi:hypothetical protein